MLVLLLSGIDVEVDVETHGQRRRCRRGMHRGHGGHGWHGMRGGSCGPWGMRGGGVGRFGCHPRGRGGWSGAWFTTPAAWCHEQPAAAATATAEQPPAGAPQPPAGASQPTNSSTTPAATVPDTNAETGEMYEATAAAACDQDWTLVNDGMTDVDAATTGVEQLHVSPAPDDIPGTASRISFFYKSLNFLYTPCFTQSWMQ